MIALYYYYYADAKYEYMYRENVETYVKNVTESLTQRKRA